MSSLGTGTFSAIHVLCWLSFAWILYSYVGYPLLLGIAAWLRPQPWARSGDLLPTVTVLMVVRNEGDRLGAKIRNLLSIDYPARGLDYIVVSDGSTDDTEPVVAGFGDERIRLLSLPGARGKAAAIGEALPFCRGEIVLFCDVRQTIEPNAVRRLVANFADPAVGAVSGELRLRPAARSEAGRGLSAYWSYEKIVRRLESQLDSVIGATGALYAVRRAAVRAPHPDAILDDVAIPMEVVRTGRRVVFEPGAVAWDDAPDDGQREYRRKVRTLAGNYQLLVLSPWLLDPLRNRLWWQFVSHKLTRLAVPWCLIVLLLTSLSLAARGGRFFAIWSAAQLTFYLLALLGWRLGRRRRAPPVFAVPTAFVIVNSAALAALFAMLRGSEKAAWKARPG